MEGEDGGEEGEGGVHQEEGAAAEGVEEGTGAGGQEADEARGEGAFLLLCSRIIDISLQKLTVHLFPKEMSR